jgi:4-hydroxybenzoate polyprenyltransferase
VFSLPFAITGFLSGIEVTGSLPEIQVIIASVLCLVLARNTAMAFNRWLDRRFDSMNPRTKNREIPSQIIHGNAVLAFTISNAVLFVLCAYFINFTAFLLSPVALLVILGYSYTKRVTWFSHYFLGSGLMIAPAGAFIAVTGFVSPEILLLSFSVLFWVAGFDILYSIQDMKFDREAGLHSIPSSFGERIALRLSRFSHLISSLLLFFWWYMLDGEKISVLLGCFIFTLFLTRQHLLIKEGSYSRINSVFFTSNGIASIVFGIFYIIHFLMSYSSLF